MSLDFKGKTVLAQFGAYLKKPIGVNTGGNRAIFYADMGDNANTVCRFSTSHFWKQRVNVAVFWVKDRDGVSMAQANGRYPLIANFLATIEHPTHSKTDGGATASFYAEQGKNGDEISKFMQDRFHDSLVYVEVRGMLSIHSPDLFDEHAQAEIVQHHERQLCHQEKEHYNRNLSRFVALNQEFQDFALSNPLVVRLIEDEVQAGRYISQKEYLKTVFLSQEFQNKGIDNACNFNQDCANPVGEHDIYLLDENNPYSWVCLCHEHQGERHNPQFALLLQAKAILNKKRWLWHYFVLNHSFSGKDQPDSRLLFAWLEKNGLTQIASKKFIRDLQKVIELG